MIDLIFPENQQSAYARTKMQISCAVSCAVTAQLISAFVFVAQTVQSFFFFNPSLYLVAIFCGCTALFVSNLVGTQIVGFLVRRLIDFIFPDYGSESISRLSCLSI